ncbi:hypothetical protein BYT27DRAFT_6750959 [Phlegmacium glaucopus]|nr:hypothetical protein BYT27DRAFT_6750959 [Phlegmacium glaucopus]
MHSFRTIIAGIFVTAATILALPMDNFPRSLSSDSLGPGVFARAIPGIAKPGVHVEEHPHGHTHVHAGASKAPGNRQQPADNEDLDLTRRVAEAHHYVNLANQHLATQVHPADRPHVGHFLIHKHQDGAVTIKHKESALSRGDISVQHIPAPRRH